MYTVSQKKEATSSERILKIS